MDNVLTYDHVDIWLIQEPSTQLPDLHPNYTFIYNQCASNSAPTFRTLTIIKTDINHRIIDISDNLIHLLLPEPKLHIVNLYWSPAHIPSSRFTSGYYDIIQNTLLNNNLIFGADLNAHHHSLGDNDDQRGKKIADLIFSSSCAAINDISIKTCRSVTTPDWTITSKNLVKLCKWSTLYDLIESDHKLITITINLSLRKSPVVSTFVHLPTFFKKILPIKIDDISDISTLPQSISQAAISSTRPTNTKKKLSYWNSALQDHQDSIKKLRSKILGGNFTGQSLKEAQETLNNLNKRYKKLLRKCKTDEFINTIKDVNTSNIQKKLLKTKKIYKPITALSVNNETVTDPQQISDILLNSFFPHKSLPPLILPQPCDDISSSQLSTKEIQLAVNFIRNVAPGFDKLNAQAIKIWFNISPQLLTSLFKHLFFNGIFPLSLGLTVIYPIPKITSNIIAISNLRPIGVRPILCKTFEYILNYRLKHHMSTNDLYPAYQHGFTPGKSCNTFLSQLMNDIKAAMSSKLISFLLSIDIKGAFNNITHQSVIDSMSRLGFSCQLIHLIAQFLSNCEMTILDSQGTPTVKKRLHYGCPQGSGLSPTVFILSLDHAIYQLAQKLHSSRKPQIKLLAFADDINILFSFEPNCLSDTINHCINDTLSKLQNCLLRSGLEVSPSKSRLLPLSTAGRNLHLLLNGHSIDPVNNLTLLGLDISTDLNFSDHVHNVITKCKRKLPHLKSLLTMQSHIKHSTKCQLIENYIYSKLYYASHIWTDCNLRTPTKTALVSLQALISKTCHSLPLCTSNYKSIALLQQPPLLLLCQERARRHRYKYYHPDLDLHFDHLMTTLPNLHPSSYDRIQTGSKIWTQNDMKNLSADFFLFTDGSRFTINLSTSAAIAVLDSNQLLYAETTWLLPHYSTVFQAETSAIVQATRLVVNLINLKPSATVFRILSDSLSAISALDTLNSKSPFIHQLLNSLSQLPNNISITFHWCKAHVDIKGNIRADQLANDNALNPQYSYTIPMPAPLSLLKSYEKQLTYRQATYQYNRDISPSSLLSLIAPTYNHPNLKTLGHRSSTALIVTEAGHFLSRLHKMNRVLTTRCPCSYDDIPAEQTAEHCLTNCQLVFTNKSILKSWTSLELPTPSKSLDIQTLLTYPKFLTFIKTNSRSILSLLRKANLYSLQFHTEFQHCLPNLKKWLANLDASDARLLLPRVDNDHGHYTLKRPMASLENVNSEHNYCKRLKLS